MSHSVLHPLPTDVALEYVCSIIEMNGDEASGNARNILRDGTFHAFAPAECSLETLLKFRFGGFRPMGQRHQVDGHVLQAIQDDAKGLAEHFIALADKHPETSIFVREPYLTDAETGNALIGIGASLYKKIEPFELGASSLADFFRYYTTGWSFMTVIARSAPPPDSLDGLIDAADCIAVNAYANEGYVVWLNRSGNALHQHAE